MQQQCFEALKENGFLLSREVKNANFVENNDIEIITKHTTDAECLILFRKRTTSTTTPVLINVEDTTNFVWLRKLQENLINTTQSIIIYVQNAPQNGILGLVNCLRREPTIGKRVCCFFIHDEKAPTFDVAHEFYVQQLRKGLAINVWKLNEWGSYRHLLLFERELFVEREHCYVNAIARGDLSSLRWIEGNLSRKIIDGELHPEQTLVHVSVYYFLFF